MDSWLEGNSYIIYIDYMKKINFIIIPLLLSFIFCIDESSKNIKQRTKLKYKVIQKFGENIEKLKATHINQYEYDVNNNKITDALYGIDTKLVYLKKYIYDKNNNKIETSFYNAKGKITEIDGLSKFIYKYDDNNNLIEESLYSSKGKLMRYHNYEYDDGKCILKSNFLANGALSSKIRYIYDSKDNLTKQYTYDEEGSLQHTYKNKYDSKKNKIETYFYKKGSFMYDNYHKSKYDDNGNIIEKSFYNDDNELVSSYSFLYDLNHNVIEELEYSYKFEFGELQKKLISKIAFKYEYYN